MKKPLPCGECKGKCCTYAPFTKREFKTVRKKYGIPNGAVAQAVGPAMLVVRDAEGTCAYLTSEGRCSVWADRPQACKHYGEVPQMPCQFLYPEKVAAMLELRQDSFTRIGKMLEGAGL